MKTSFDEIIEQIRKEIPKGIIDVQVNFIGEYVSDDEEQISQDGYYVCEIRFDEDDKIDENYSCNRKFVSDDGQGFDPQIAGIDDFELYPFEIISYEKVS